MAKLADNSIVGFNQLLASSAPTPGGGSVAGLSASLGASLTMMVINLTRESGLEGEITRLEEMRKEALDLIDRDAESFEAVMSAFKLPKGTDEEKTERRQKIQDTLLKASLIPLMTMKLGLRLLRLARKVVEVGNPNAVSDIGVAGLMTAAAVEGARYNVLINAYSLKDNEKAKELLEEVREITAECRRLREDIARITEEKIME